MTITFNEGQATLNGQPFENGASVSADGLYTIVVTDDANNQSTVNFGIDTRIPALASLIISDGDLSPTFSRDVMTYSTTVSNGVYGVSVTAATYSPNTELMINGQTTTNNTPIFVNLKVGANEIPITVSVPNSVQTETVKTYTINVYRKSKSSGGSNASAGSSPSNTGFAVIVNGVKQEQIATATTTQEGNRTAVTATLDNAKLANQLAALGENPMVIVPVTTSADKVSAVLTGESVKMLENKQGTLRIETPIAAYDIPANLIAIDNVSAQFGSTLPLSDVMVHVSIEISSADKASKLTAAGNRQGFTLSGAPIDFSIQASHGEQTVTVDKFPTYVQREIVIPDGVDASKITTAVVLNPDGTVHHVPTTITVRDGKYFASINSLTNSTYSLIYNQKTFDDISSHWSKDAVEDMASRLVINGEDATHFNPDASITRAEFAAIVVRGLGLAEDQTTNQFKDVTASDWFSGAVAKAVEYHLIQGYEDGTFGPNQTITREEALVLVSRAMDVAGKEGISVNVHSALGKFADHLEVSDWAAKDVAKTVTSGLAQGTGEKLEPQTNITRAETATLIQRLLSKFSLINKRMK
ncbi:S-layer homology domain-containing protein [Paenibacillus hexagrammi]|uniref:S-layer homology domain-containing protein n=1 Tax=Paenibacillus hexagrammi TaxID=2908839 RepID=A0ABY3SII9_9BACL|nr:S-layer homology domain-containing protein [Paenibacillus sp. YPD9-1]UJF33603.1 S-layer homology domain-containing protein [Paenibacillus sp. YPD9-1]